MVLRWPADFPEDCPPDEAYPAIGVYYRIVKTDPPEPGDFVSIYYLNRRRANDMMRRGLETQCTLMGLSVYADANDAIWNARRYHSLGDKIARLTLEADAGKMLPTPRDGNSHHTLWQADGYNPVAIATVVMNLRR